MGYIQEYDRGPPGGREQYKVAWPRNIFSEIFSEKITLHDIFFSEIFSENFTENIFSENFSLKSVYVSSIFTENFSEIFIENPFSLKFSVKVFTRTST